MIAARIDAFVRGSRLGMVVHQPHTGTGRIIAVTAGTQRQIDASSRPHIESVPRDPGFLRDGIPIEIGRRRMVAVRMNENGARSDVQYSKFRQLIRPDQYWTIPQSEWKR